MGESFMAAPRPSNLRGDKSVTQKIRRADDRISFRDLARFAFGKQAVAIVAGLTRKNERTVKRWFARRSKAPDRAVVLVFGEIMRRYG
jgi:hypothetical protein